MSSSAGRREGQRDAGAADVAERNRGLASALFAIPAEDREVWVRMAMAIKSALGEAGYALWDEWSQSSERYERRSARAVWRSCRASGGVTIRSLYGEARRYGWRGEERVPPARDGRAARKAAAAAARERSRRAAAAALRAARMLREAELSTHPYLAAKGFPAERALVRRARLLLPMRDARSGRLQSLQTIDAAGGKRFLPGGAVRGAVLTLGAGARRWYVEGFATALAVRAALRSSDRHDQVVVCFSAANLAQVARQGYVVADHDWWHCASASCRHRWDAPPEAPRQCPACGGRSVTAPAGERYALASGLPYCLAPTPGSDACDYLLEHGVEALAGLLESVLEAHPEGEREHTRVESQR